VCHQTVSLAARHLEANGIATVILGSARDVVEHCGVPRFVFTDFPLGNPCGRPFDAAMQRQIVLYGLSLLESALFPRTTVQTPFVWSEDHSWRENYMKVDPDQVERYRLLGEARRAAREATRAAGRLRGWTSGELYQP
jgi:D-proline reductase (dithiol) PrdB